MADAAVALVTGSASGIGRAIAHRLAGAGYLSVLTDIDAEGGGETAREIQADGGRAAFLAADMGRPDDVRRLVEEVLRRFGTLDVLVNNVGIAADPPFPEAAFEVWQNVIDVNLVGTLLATQLALEAMRGRAGAIVNVASSAGWGLAPHESPVYAATKAAIMRLTAALGSLQEEGIVVSAICPGWVATDKVQATLEALPRKERARTAPRRLITPEEIGELVLMAVRDKAMAGRIFVWPDDKPLFVAGGNEGGTTGPSA